MARGYLYNAGKVELEPGLMDALADLKTNESTEVSEDFSNVMSGIAEDIRSCMTADYVIEKILNEAEYLVDINDWQDDFSDMINKYGGEAFVFEDNVIFRINQTACKYRLHLAICTDFFCHLSGEIQPPYRSCFPLVG